MFNIFNIFKKKSKTAEQFISEDYIDDNGNAVINVDIKRTSDLFSPYSNGKMLNPTILNYLDTTADPIPNKYPLLINFIVKDKEKVNQVFVKKALKRYYWLSYQQKMKKMKKEYAFSIFLLLGGLAALSFGIIFRTNGDSVVSSIINEFSFLIAWIFLWESISNFVIGRQEKIIDRDDEKQMALAKIYFRNRKQFRQKVKQFNSTNHENIGPLAE
jgi:hypothetical protein